jgi:hypothetical protein
MRLTRLRRERIRRESDQRRAWQVQDILVGCGLFQSGYGIAGGIKYHVPYVVSLDRGPPESLEIRILPGQMPNDYAAHAQRIAYNLRVNHVEVITLDEPYMIRLELYR